MLPIAILLANHELLSVKLKPIDSGEEFLAAFVSQKIRDNPGSEITVF